MRIVPLVRLTTTSNSVVALVTYIAFVALLNLSLGFALAVYLLPVKAKDLPFSIPVPRFLRRRGRSKIRYVEGVLDDEEPEGAPEEPPAPQEATSSDAAPAEPDSPNDAPPPAHASEEVIPAKLLEELENHGIEAKSLVEATAIVLKLQLAVFRKEMVDCDDTLRSLEDGDNGDLLENCVNDLKDKLQAWEAHTNEAESHLAEHLEKDPELSHTAGKLLEALRHHREDVAELAKLVTAEDRDAPAELKRALIDQLVPVFDSIHRLRESMVRNWLEIKIVDNSLAEISGTLAKDPMTRLHNFAGFYKTAGELIQSDDRRSRQVSCVLVNIDRFHNVIEQVGISRADSILLCCAEQISNALRQDRGFDLACSAGSRFYLILADTGPRNATCAAERIRQTMELAEFVVGEEKLRLTLTCAAAELRSIEALEDFIARLETTLTFAKEHGPNCTTLDEGNGPSTIEPPNYDVPHLTFRI